MYQTQRPWFWKLSRDLHDVLQDPIRAVNAVAVNCFAVLADFVVFLFTKLKYIPEVTIHTTRDDLDFWSVVMFPLNILYWSYIYILLSSS